MPQSMTMMPSACSSARQFIPISPRPPSGTTRSESPEGGFTPRASVLGRSPMTELRRVSPADAKKLLDAGYTYVDVRTVEEFDAQHPADAINVPLNLEGPSTDVPEFVRVMRRLFAPEGKIVVGCATGMRSLRALQWLSKAGFTDVVDQRDGMDGARTPFGG